MVASVEYRTSNESVFPEPLIDAKAAIRYLKAHAEDFCIDVERICVMGESAGGTMASLVGLTGNVTEFEQGDFENIDSSVQAVVDFYGPIDFNHISLDTSSNDVPPWILQDFLGLDYTEEMADKASAITYITEKTPPVLILHGSSDIVAPISQSEKFYEKLQKAGVVSDLYILNGAEHGADCFYQEKTLCVVDEFLKKVL